MVMSVNSKMTAIADAIRNLLDISGTMGLDAMASNISSITKRGAVAGMISTKSEQYIIPAGYHNGNGSVGIADAEKAKIIAENIKNGVTILGVSGTASGDIYAIISVTYPEGSVCTCSDGTTTLKARDTSGKTLFNVPAAGTWTVTAKTTDGSKEKSVDVTITAAGQVESVTIIYVPYLYNHGDECTDLTGGWQSRALKGNDGSIDAKAPTLTKGTNSMTIQWIGSGSGVCEIIKDVDLTAHSSINWDGTFTPSGNNNIGTKVSVIKRSSSYWFTGSAAYANISVKSLDISSLTGSYDIVIGCQNNANTETAVITEMRLE